MEPVDLKWFVFQVLLGVLSLHAALFFTSKETETLNKCPTIFYYSLLRELEVPLDVSTQI